MKDYGITILRLFVGFTFLMHAYLALVRFTPAGEAAFMKAVGLPAPVLLAWLVIVVHGVGGILLALGLWTRLAAAANALIMLTALVQIHFKQGFFMKVMAGGQFAGGFEFPLLLFGATLALVLLGPGALSASRS